MTLRLLPANMSAADRAVRLTIGLLILSLTVVGPRTWWGLLGLVPIGTSLLGSCPLYTLAGWSSRRGAGASP